MRKIKPIVWLILLVIIGSGIAYAAINKSSREWQAGYRDRVTNGIVQLLQENPYDKKAVVIIVIDGLRWEEGPGAEDQYFPHIWNELRPLGTLLTNYYIASPTVTTSSHSAMITGRISTVPNDGHIRPVFPTIHEYFRDARADYMETEIERITDPGDGFFKPNATSLIEVESLVADALNFAPERTACYLGKDLIHSLNQSSCGRYPADDVFLIDSMRDMEVTEYFLAKIGDVKPSMVLVNLGDVDETGHEAEWFYYADAIRWADRHTWDIWQSLQALNRYRDNTYFIVTTDHGRHIPDRGGYPHHGCFCEGCQHSFMFLIGPGIRQNYVSDVHHTELDLAPTVGAMMGFATPGSTGEPMMEIFEDPSTLPERRMTETMEAVAEDVANIDERDTTDILVGSLREVMEGDTPVSSAGNAFYAMAIASRHLTNNDVPECAELKGELYDMLIGARSITDLSMGYPFILNARAAGGSFDQLDYSQASDLLDFIKSEGYISSPESESITELGNTDLSLIAPFIASLGAMDDDPEATRFAYDVLLNRLELLEGADRANAPDLNSFITGPRYREGPNEIFTEVEVPMRDRMWLIWSIERVLAESNPGHVPDLYPLLNRQYRLLIAYVHEWQDANAMIGGTGDFTEDIDFVSQGLSLAFLAEFEPWRRWELDELGYSFNIYATALFSWPPHHFFYILGQANALAGAWAANERLQLYVNDNGSIRKNLVGDEIILSPGDPSYVENAAALAYGLARFSLSDYQLYDLEMYPIIHQQD